MAQKIFGKESFSRRVWEGDSSTIEDAARHYRRNPQAYLQEYATTLYSFRRMRALAALGGELYLRANDLVRASLAPSFVPANTAWLDSADVVSTHLLALSQYPGCDAPARRDYFRIARDLSNRGVLIGEMANLPAGGLHSLLLLRLTAAHAALLEDDSTTAEWQMALASRAASRISDPEQRARVYRKLGMLYRKLGQWARGWGWGIRACCVPSIARKTRLKSLAALTGAE